VAIITTSSGSLTVDGKRRSTEGAMANSTENSASADERISREFARQGRRQRVTLRYSVTSVAETHIACTQLQRDINCCELITYYILAVSFLSDE